MSEYLDELKELIRKWIPDEEMYIEQKTSFLSQVNLRSVVIEGLKLLSIIIEIDSCKKHGCVHNKNKTVNQILRDHRIVGPTLPDVVPDGYRVIGSTIILLEAFVRVSHESFEIKYKSDFEKLMQLSKDLSRCGLTLIPVVDGRSNYYTEHFPDWTIERMRWLILKITNFLRDNGEEIEELEYSRLVYSLSNMENKNLGLESLKILKEEGLDYKAKLMSVMRDGVNSNMSASECRVEMAKIYDQFSFLRKNGLYKDVYCKTSRTEIINWLKDHKLILLSGETRTAMLDERQCGYCRNHMFRILASLIKNKRHYQSLTNPKKCGSIQSHKKLLSDCNKIKGLKVLNTRRFTLLCLDVIILNSLLELIDAGEIDNEFLVNNHFKSVNDRLVSIDLIIDRLNKKLMSKPNWIGSVKYKMKRTLEIHGLYYVSKWLKQVDIDSWYEFKMMREHSDKCVKPTLKYKKDAARKCGQPEFGSSTILDDEVFLEYLEALSTLSLGLVNSMKTSSAAKFLINDKSNYFGTVQCNECYFQDLDKSYNSLLIYQKTGERSRCYGLMFKSEQFENVYEVGESFYADPKRFFLPIMSSEVILKMCVEMLSWLDWLSEQELKAFKSKLYTLIINILTVPSKRVQVYLQGFRYLIMAFVNELHFKELQNKLKVQPLTISECYVFTLMDDLVHLLLTEAQEENMSKVFRFVLNLSYLCHLVTKETPDRLTDQIKCFEKFLEPKVDFNSVFVNLDSSPHLSGEVEEKFIKDLNRLFSKDLGVEDLKDPGISKELISLCASCFNCGLLPMSKVLKHDPQSPSFTSTALDISSNKSVVVPKLDEVGETVTQYDYQSLLSSTVVDMAQSFKDKLKYKLDRKSIQFAIFKRLTNMVLKRKTDHDVKDDLDDELSEIVDDDTLRVINDVEANVSECLSKMGKISRAATVGGQNNLGRFEKIDTLKRLWDRESMNFILMETSLHEVKDFDPSIFPIEKYKSMCELVYDSKMKSEFFTDEVLKFCPLDLLVKNLATKCYLEEDFFECFKYILISAGFDNRVGRYDHRSRSRLGFKDEAILIKENSRISSRESNSEAISRRLDKSFFTNSSLRNLCFYSEESPTYRSTVSSSVGKLKFGLSYKEQVGSNRELYVGDLNTKLTSRLIEDYFESLTSECKFSCLNNDAEFERALLDMKCVVRLSGLAVSMDHSKWGPYMSPAIFNILFSNLNLELNDGVFIDKAPIENLLNWHLHKIVEVPYNVIDAYLKGYTKRRLGLMDRSSTSITEDFIFNWFAKGVVPSHISSVLDMGQGILHNTSDYYGLLTEQFILQCLDFIFDIKSTAYTSSDDEILLSNSPSLKKVDEDSLDINKCQEVLEFHNYLSSKFNKFVSPKTVAGSFASEFKSRFFIWSQEVPLLTKFVAAALHNVKAKSPHQLAETVDTILDQCIANGVSIEVVKAISRRTNKLITYSGHPKNPFLCVENTDLKDWVDGSRGYRLQRSVESLFNDDDLPLTIRNSCRSLFHRIRSGDIQEEFLINALQTSPDECLAKMLRLSDVDESTIDKVLEFRWLNLRAHGDLRLVLRTKVMSGTRILDREEVPSLVKSVQSKLSKNFVRGAKKIITDAINKSAFQSSICSGFIGFCKSMGSKCVRDGNGSFQYIKHFLKSIILHSHCEVCKPEMSVFCRAALEELKPFSRPIFWDYFSLTFSNACELGNWVFSNVTIPKRTPTTVNPNFFWPVKPGSHTELEDKVNMNHVLYSIKRNFPDLFDEHIAPFLSDLNSLKISWIQRIKFLDLCVAMDMSSECLGIISHIMRRKREELYIVKQNELSVAHMRDSSPMEAGYQLNSSEICHNFLCQLVFESMLHPVLLTTGQFKKYFWFGEVELLPNEADHDLGQLTQFVMDCKTLNISRCMSLDDLDVGYVHSSILMGDIYVNFSSFLHLLDWENRRNYKTFDEIILCSREDTIPMEIDFTISHSRKSFKFKYERKTNYHIKSKVLVQKVDIEEAQNQGFDILELEVHEIECFVSGSQGNHISLDGVGLIPLHPLFSGKEFLDVNKLLIKQDENFESTHSVFSKVKLNFSNHTKDLKNKYSYKLQGPEYNMNPLHLYRGQIMENNFVISRLDVQITSRSVFLALEALESEDRIPFLISLHIYTRSNNKKENSCFIRMTQSDLCLLIDSYEKEFTEVLKSLSDWMDFGDFALCFSNNLNCIMIADPDGQFKLKGRQCRKVSSASAPLEID
ncbi:RNA-dependent RNA polymerase [Mammarenavirus bearense]|uniref:RNA-directed RNA polymerase L n=1 Tax=Bear Canyon mammarenavirus (isolate Mouse/United States/AV A0070039/2000) TaxID=3052298 RepID=L_BCNVU|nr:RNA-dependent RNA polymerase [Mammarenavirus bearense]A0PJ24.1 RecName: Full=RNA-directed RNA polymerase L; Short=Protein L; AltName: Full=Large structural protein; AltName: Full=Replicase; AltName: Full=Transcriptase; Includes: RecName: Full=cap-snatching endonuclease [Mammarenavirus bearense]AAX99344.1 RNA-dependent RNA polymerase [Mammarenavirus bearense]